MKCCTSLTDVYLGDSLSVISDCMFDFCSNLSVLVIPSSVTRITKYAFSSLSENTGLTEADKDVSGVTAKNITLSVKAKIKHKSGAGVSACSAFFGGFAANG